MQGLRAIAAPPGRAPPLAGRRRCPKPSLSAEERRASAALMRVNHAGEIAAQALYNGQSLFARSEATRGAARERGARGARPPRVVRRRESKSSAGARACSTPFWYAGSFGIGVLAGASRRCAEPGLRRGDRAASRSASHRSPEPLARRTIAKSDAILSRMAEDEAHHGTTASLAGGAPAAAADPPLHDVRRRILRRIALIV